MVKIVKNKKKLKKNKMKLKKERVEDVAKLAGTSSSDNSPEISQIMKSEKKSKDKKKSIVKRAEPASEVIKGEENCRIEDGIEDSIKTSEFHQEADQDTEENNKSMSEEKPIKKKKIKGKLQQRSEASQHLSEFNLTEVGKEKVKLDELIKTSTKISGQVSTKKQLEKAKKLKSLSIPMNKPQAEKIRRTIAYDKVCDEVSKWDTIVKSNRDAEQMVYPLKKPEIHLESFEDASKRFISKHPVEEAVAEVLKTSENVLDQKRPLTVAEEKALQAMDINTAKQKHDELMRAKALLSYQQAKAKRQSKIKSKRYHRILKRDKLKRVMQEFDELKNKDQKAALEKFLEADKLRILERMTLKHRNTGKWAKQQKIRAKYNPECRSNLKEDLIIGRKLREKVAVDLPKAKEIIDEVDPEDKYFRDSSEKFLIEDVPFGNSSADLSPSDCGSNFVQSVTQKLPENSNSEEGNSKVKGNTGFSSSTNLIYGAEEGFDGVQLQSMPTDGVEFGDYMDDIDDEEKELVTMDDAFADNEVISEFKEEKKAAEKANRRAGIDLFLPGWGSWGGPGIKPSKRKRKRFFIKPLEPPPKKNTLGHVIINEDSDKKAAEHQVSQLPFPFSNVHQFESYIRQPISHTWNPQSSFQSLVAPKVVTKLGQIIDPIDSEDVVLKKKPDTKHPKVKQKKESQEIMAF